MGTGTTRRGRKHLVFCGEGKKPYGTPTGTDSPRGAAEGVKKFLDKKM